MKEKKRREKENKDRAETSQDKAAKAAEKTAKADKKRGPWFEYFLSLIHIYWGIMLFECKKFPKNT